MHHHRCRVGSKVLVWIRGVLKKVSLNDLNQLFEGLNVQQGYMCELTLKGVFV